MIECFITMPESLMLIAARKPDAKTEAQKRMLLAELELQGDIFGPAPEIYPGNEVEMKLAETA